MSADSGVAPQEEAHAVRMEAEDAGVWVFSAGLEAEALEWAAKIAAACRCSQDVFELLPDPTD